MGGGGSKSSNISQDFDPKILEDLPEDVKNRIEKCAENYENCIDELKERYDKLKVDSEQKYFEVEKSLLTASEKLDGETRSASELRHQLTVLEKKYNEASANARLLQTTQFEIDKKSNELEVQTRQLTREKDDLISSIEKKTQEVDRLTEDWKQMSDKLAEANRSKIEALAKVDEVHSLELSSQHREQRTRQEFDQLQQRHDWLDTQVQELTSQLLCVRKEQAGKQLELQSLLEEKSDEVNHLQQMNDSLKVTKEDQRERLEASIEKSRESQENQIQLEEQYRAELLSQEKLTNIYKNAASVKEKQVEELMPAIEELRGLLKESAEAQAEVEREKEVEEEQWKLEIKTKDDEIARLQREILDSNELIDAMKKKGVLPPTEENVEALSPAAANASRLLKSGMTLTQIYSEYVQCQESLHLEKEESQRVNQYLDQILQEIEEKAPVLKKQREDYENSLETISQLTAQLDKAMLECEKLRLSNDDSRRRSNELTRENQRLQQSNVDLGQQVRMLLKELSEARGTVVSMATDADVSCADVTSSSYVITERLVTFKSIEDLQEQNQRLLVVIRDLSEKQEKEEEESEENRVAELKMQLERALSEIEDMQTARQRQTEMVESIVRQRDMYKLMLSQQGGSPGIQTSMMSPQPTQPFNPHAGHGFTPPAVTSTPAVSQRSPDEKTTKALEETENKLKDVQEEFTVYRREKGENEKILSEQVDKLKQEVSDFRVLNAKLSSQLDFSAERYKVLQMNVEGYKKEISVLREQTQKKTGTIQKHEEITCTLRQELMSCQEKLSRAEVQLHSVRIEKDMLRNISDRLTQEKESIMVDLQSRDLVAANLESLQNKMDRSEFETRTRFTQKIESLEKENGTLRRKIDGLHEDHNKRTASLEKQLADARADLDSERISHQAATGRYKSLTEQLQRELSETETQLKETRQTPEKHPEPIQRVLPDPKQEETIKDLKTQLNMANAKIKALTSQLEDTKRQVEQHKIVAISLEENIKEEKLISNQLKESVTGQLEETKKECERLEGEVRRLEEARSAAVSQYEEISAENKRLATTTQFTSAGQQRQLTSLQTEVRSMMEQRDQARDNEKAARTEAEEQAKLANEAQDTYQRELMLHAADVSALTAVKQELEGFQEKLHKAEAQAAEAQAALKASEELYKEREATLKADHVKLESRNNDILQQNRMVHEELEMMSTQLVQLQQSREKESEDQSTLDDTLSHAGEEKSSKQLLEVIRFLRKEKEIAETSLEVVQAERNRLKQQLEYHIKQYNDANQALAAEREKNQMTMQTAAQHADLMRKVETLNLLHDSNKMLRDDKTRISQQITELEAKNKKLEEEITPLQESSRELQGQVDALEAERTTLQAEVQRWKARTNHLIEQCNKTDPEEFKRITIERDQLKSQVTKQTEEIQKLKAALSKENLQHISVQKELTSTRETVASQFKEITELKASIEEKEKDVEEKNKTILQLKKIGRKYRVQFEEAQKQTDELKASNAVQLQEAAHQAQIKDLEEQLKTSEEDLNSVTERFDTIDAERNESLKKLKEEEGKVASLTEDLDKANKELAAVKETLAKEKETLAKEREESAKEKEASSKEKDLAAKDKEALAKEKEALAKEKEALAKEKELSAKLRQDLSELEKKQNQSKTILTTAKTRINHQKSEIESRTSEIKSLKEQLDASQQRKSELEAQCGALRSQFEAKQKEAGKQPASEAPAADNTELLNELDKLKAEKAELLQKMKQLETQQKQTQPTQPRPSVSVSTADRPGTSTSDSVKTANIKPMVTAASSSRPIQSALIQPVRSTPADIRVRASVSPRAVTTTTTSLSQTPTATVMPTTVTVQDIGESSIQQMAPPGHAQLSPQQMAPAVRPMQQVQPVSQHVEEIVSDVSTEPEQSQEPLHLPAAEVTVAAEDTATPSTSQMPVAVAMSSKRPREEAETTTDEEQTPAPVKRTKTQEQTESENAPTLVVSDVDIETQFVDRRRESAEVAIVEPAIQQPVEEVQPQAEQPAITPVSATPTPTSAVTTPSVTTVDLSIQQEDILTLEGDNEQTDDTTQESETIEQPVEGIFSSGGSQEGVDAEDGTALEDQGLEEQAEETSEPEGGEAAEETAIQEIDGTAGAADGKEEEQEYQEVEAIVLSEDDEDDYEGQMEEYEEVEEEEEEEEEEEGDLEEIGEEMQESYDEGEDEEMGEELDEPMQEEGEDEDDDEDVILVEDDIEPSPEEVSMEPPVEEHQASSTSSQQQSGSAAVGRTMPQLSSQPDRLQPSGRAQQLPPFSFGQEQGSYDIGDDGIVPSTPTLVLPRRHDDFAQAVSSPQVQRRFVFGAGADMAMQNPEFGRLETQGALGVDDIRMDLTQFDEGAGRSVPVTPTPTTQTPTISITEPSPPHESADSQPPVAVIGQPEGSPQPENIVPDAPSPQTSEPAQEAPLSSLGDPSDVSEQGQGEGGQVVHGEGSQSAGSEVTQESGQVSAEGDEETEEDSQDADTEDRSKEQADKADATGARPKIQRIIWDKPGTSGSTPPQLSASPSHLRGVSPGVRRHQSQMRSRMGHIRGRGFHMQRPMQRTVHQQPHGQQSPHGQQQHQQQPLLQQGQQIPSLFMGQARGRGNRSMKRGGPFHHHRNPPPF